MASKLPKLVISLTHSHNAWIVGSAANPKNNEPRDYDVIVPFSEWHKACMLIPMDASPNHFGGWKCISEGVEVDVWPGDIGVVIMQHPMSQFVWHPATGTRWNKVNQK